MPVPFPSTLPKLLIDDASMAFLVDRTIRTFLANAV
jgi:hypothetical protein